MPAVWSIADEELLQAYKDAELAAVQGRVVSYSIAGRSASLIPLPEIRAARRELELRKLRTVRPMFDKGAFVNG